MKKIGIIVTLIAWAVICNAQVSDGLSYFNLSMLNENDDMPSQAFVSVNFHKTSVINLESYSGNDADITKLSLLIKDILSDNKNGYLNASEPSDTTVGNSFEFYKLFVSHSKKPKLFYTTEFGMYKLFYVELEQGIPLIVFCFEKTQNGLKNNPIITEHPGVAALIDAVNKTYLLPGKFKVQKNIPVKNTVIKFDSVYDHPSNGLSFYFDLQKVKFDINDEKDSTNVFDKKQEKVLNFYRTVIKKLKTGGMPGYYSNLSAESKQRLEESFKLANNSEEGLNYYKKFISSYSYVFSILDLGEIKLLYANNSNNNKNIVVRKVYILEGNKGMKIINENSEFYFDELLRTNEFRKVIFE